MFIRLLYDPGRKDEFKNKIQEELKKAFRERIFIYNYPISPIHTISPGDNILFRYAAHNFLLRVVDTIFIGEQKFFCVDFVFYPQFSWEVTPKNSNLIQDFLESNWEKIEVKQAIDIWRVIRH